MRQIQRDSPVRKALTAGQARLVCRAALIAALIAGAGIFHVASHGRAVQAGYALGKIEREHRALLRQREQLLMERATLSSAARLESIARDQLKLAPPSARQIVTLPNQPAAQPTSSASLASLQRAATTEPHL
ncbi:MAG: cell division protein FtsL [Myxococcales bacterium]|jgi:cell division protein FtsL|nr:cell division protein FtsL [Myxococcales bacterium]